ncbi:hypothetical protein APHAL10511_007283 [Amanita phalloides]|nr:hypothetical protein APHAL10511_007283 [Amanita phalloides]
MSSNSNCSAPGGKGKRRAQDPTEGTPLIAGSSRLYATVEPVSTAPISRRTLSSKLVNVFLISLLFSIIAFVVAALLAWSYVAQASTLPPGDLVTKSVVFKYPSHVDVLSVKHGAIWLKVQGKLGVDAGTILGIRRNPDGDSLLTDIWKSLGRWGVRRLDKVNVQMSPIHVTPEYDPSLVLATVYIAALDVPLNPSPSSDANWLHDVTIEMVVQPTSNTTTILHFMQGCWSRGRIDVRAEVDSVSVRGGGIFQQDWRNWLHTKLSRVRVPLHFKIPLLPGLPSPGSSFPAIGNLVTLQEFHVISQNDTMALNARATLINPAPMELQMEIPSLPFIVSIPSPNETFSTVPIASVSTLPFTLTHPNITLLIHGTVLPLQSSTSGVLSTFVSRYLSGKSNSISISSPLRPDLSILATFPAPTPRPQLLQNVTIRNMKVRPKGSTFVASGLVFVRLVLPKGMDIALDVHRVFPDVLVFDGEVTEFHGLPPDTSLPDPLPENAFAHIRPDDWLPSLCVREKSRDGDGATYSITAAITDVPLQVLPGREMQFSNFVGKVIFGSAGALAGLLGSASVIVTVEGLPVDNPGQNHELELDGLPFHGSVRIGKKSG